MNYYYELPEDISVFGRPGGGYFMLTDCSPAEGGWTDHVLHNHAYKYAERVWLENANGVTLVKEPGYKDAFKSVDEIEFTWIKLKARRFEF